MSHLIRSPFPHKLVCTPSVMSPGAENWNLILNPELDSENYKHINNPIARDEVIKIIDENGYIDV